MGEKSRRGLLNGMGGGGVGEKEGWGREVWKKS
jgi:hypothetical protein